jgi:hypothetical protein
MVGHNHGGPGFGGQCRQFGANVLRMLRQVQIQATTQGLQRVKANQGHILQAANLAGQIVKRGGCHRLAAFIIQAKQAHRAPGIRARHHKQARGYRTKGSQPGMNLYGVIFSRQINGGPMAGQHPQRTIQGTTGHGAAKVQQ